MDPEPIRIRNTEFIYDFPNVCCSQLDVPGYCGLIFNLEDIFVGGTFP